MPDNRPIGIFDSGVGGLTVLRALNESLPEESTIYLGDLARCPYGPRSQDEVRDFALQIGDLLVHHDIKLLVVACNTATAAAYTQLCARYQMPVVGVIAPGAREAVRITRTGRIGVIATDGTVASDAYRTSILRHLPTASVFQASASWLVPLIERGPFTHAQVEQGLAPTLADMRAKAVDTLILGCTHFPLVRDTFDAGVGAEIRVIDSAATTAAEVARLLRSHDLLSTRPPHHRLLVTGPAEAFAERAQAMFRSSPVIETIDLLPLGR